MYIFGYGSIIWRPDFAYQSTDIGTVHGFERRFWQASHDHRGTPELPGRVVTLVPAPQGFCSGMVYTLDPVAGAETLQSLDVREQDGYQRAEVPVMLNDGTMLSAITWIADELNPSWRGGESIQQVAHTIAHRSGPSGSNRDYLQNLHDALDQLDISDTYITQLWQAVERV